MKKAIPHFLCPQQVSYDTAGPFVDQECQYIGDQVLEKIKRKDAEQHHGRHIRDSGVNRRTHSDDRFQGHPIKSGIQRKHHKGVDKYEKNADGDRGYGHPDDRPFFGAVCFIDPGGQQDEDRRTDEIGEFSHKGGLCTLNHKLQQKLQHDYFETGQRSQKEPGKESREVCDVKFHERRRKGQ